MPRRTVTRSVAAARRRSELDGRCWLLRLLGGWTGPQRAAWDPCSPTASRDHGAHARRHRDHARPAGRTVGRRSASCAGIRSERSGQAATAQRGCVHRVLAGAILARMPPSREVSLQLLLRLRAGREVWSVEQTDRAWQLTARALGEGLAAASAPALRAELRLATAERAMSIQAALVWAPSPVSVEELLALGEDQALAGWHAEIRRALRVRLRPAPDLDGDSSEYRRRAKDLGLS